MQDFPTKWVVHFLNGFQVELQDHWVFVELCILHASFHQVKLQDAVVYIVIEKWGGYNEIKRKQIVKESKRERSRRQCERKEDCDREWGDEKRVRWECEKWECRREGKGGGRVGGRGGQGSRGAGSKGKGGGRGKEKIL